MNIRILAGALGAALLLAGSAQAANITNYDQVARKVTIVKGGERQQLDLKPEETLENICDKGCTVQMEDGETFELEGQEITAIEDGKIFVDGYLNEQGDGANATDESSDAPTPKE